MAERGRWLLRHGETTGGGGFRGSTDDALTGAGHTAMRVAVSDFEPPSLVVTSPRVRCRAFAQSYAARHGLDVVVEEELREMDFGEWEGCTAGDILRRSPAMLEAFWRDPFSTTPPGGEPFAVFVERVTAAWARVAARGEQRILVVSHAGPMRVVLVNARAMPLSRLFDVDIPYASLHRVE